MTRKRRRTPPTKRAATAPRRPAQSPSVQVVTPKQLAAVRRTARQHPAARWNPNPDEVRRSVARLVLTLVELIRKVMERQAIHRMERRTLSTQETEAVGAALMEIERTIRDMGKMFDLTPEDLNIDLGSIKLL